MKLPIFNTMFICNAETYTTHTSLYNMLASDESIVVEEMEQENIIFTIKPDNPFVRSCLPTTVMVKLLSQGSKTKVEMRFQLHKYLELFLKIYSLLLLAIESTFAVIFVASQLSSPALLFAPILLEALLLLISISGLYLGSKRALNIICQTICAEKTKCPKLKFSARDGSTGD